MSLLLLLLWKQIRWYGSSSRNYWFPNRFAANSCWKNKQNLSLCLHPTDSQYRWTFGQLPMKVKWRIQQNRAPTDQYDASNVPQRDCYSLYASKKDRKISIYAQPLLWRLFMHESAENQRLQLIGNKHHICCINYQFVGFHRFVATVHCFHFTNLLATMRFHLNLFDELTLYY